MIQPFFHIAFVNTNGGSNKFWKASLGFNMSGEAAYIATYGKVGTEGSKNRQYKGSHQKNWDFLKAKIKEKLRKGYVIDKHNTSKHFIVPKELAGKLLPTEKVDEVKALSRSVSSHMRVHYEINIKTLVKDEDGTREAKEVDRRPKKTRTGGGGLSTIMSQRKKDALFEL